MNKNQPSPVFPRRSVIEIQDTYSKTCTLERKPKSETDGGLALSFESFESTEKKEEGSKSESNSPHLATATNRKLAHRRSRSSGQVIDLDLSDIDLSIKEGVMSPNRAMSPIHWEAYGSNRTDEVDPKVYPLSCMTLIFVREVKFLFIQYAFMYTCSLKLSSVRYYDLYGSIMCSKIL